jgi:hypothetical protein
MDPSTIAIVAASIIASRFSAEFVGQETIAASSTIRRIHEFVRSKSRGDAEVDEILNRLEAKPTSQPRTAELAEVLAERVETDPAFAAELARLVEEARAEPITNRFVTTVRDNAQVGKLTNIGTVEGDVHF